MICRTCKFEGSQDFFCKYGITQDKTRGLCKKCKSLNDKRWREANKEKLKKYFYNKWRNDEHRRKQNKLLKELQRFGINATKFVKDRVCEICGMTNMEHFEKYSERLHIHHIQNDGRKNMRLGFIPSHDIKSFKILCRSCHVTTDNFERKYKNGTKTN